MTPLGVDMKRYIKLYIKLIEAKIMQMAEYRSDMLTMMASSYGYNILSLIFLAVLFENFETIAGWGKHEIILLYGMGQLVFYMFHAFLSSIEDISDNIWQGDLDRMLLRPISPNFTLIFSSFNLVHEFPAMLLAIGIIIYALYQLGISIVFGFSFLLVFSVTGIFLYALVKLCIGYLAFWFEDTKDINRFHWHMVEHARFPIEIFPKPVQLGLKTIFPTSLVSYAPVYFLVFGFDKELLGFYLISQAIFIGLTWVLWSRGIKNYSSVSS